MSRQSLTTSYRDFRPKPRRGAVLIAVLACMMVTVVLIGGAMKSTLAARKQCKTELHYQQAALLLQAGIDRVQSLSEAVAPEIWNAGSAFPNYANASVEYLLVEAADSTAAKLKCTAKLAVSNRSDELIQLSRTIPFSKTTP